MKKEGMKTKDVVEAIVALVVFLIAAYFIYNMLNPSNKGGKSTKGAQVTVVTPLQAQFSGAALNTLSNSNQTTDFYLAPDLHSGLGNTHPFSQ